MTGLNFDNFNQNIEGTDFLSAHSVLKTERVKDAFARIVGEKKEIISHATVDWISKMQIGSGEEDVIRSLFSHLFELEAKYKTVEEELSSLKVTTEVYKQKAYVCGLTNTLNRNFFNEFIDFFEKRRKKSELGLSTYFFYMDLVKFKQINDTYGHKIGDEVLIEFSKRLSQVIRSEDNELFNLESLITKNFIARVGGDEFIGKIELPTEQDAKNLKVRILNSMEIPFKTSVGPLQVGTSIGFEKIQNDVDLNDVLKEADRKMYEDKRR